MSVKYEYEYTPEGLLKSAISQGMRYSYAYDAAGRLTEKKASGRTLSAFRYDPNGNLTHQTDVTGKVTEYRYDLADNISEVWDDGKKIAEYEYNADDTVKKISSGSLYTEYAYDADRNLTGLKTMSGTDVIVDNRYRYDGNGNQLEKIQKHGTIRYSYDSMKRLNKVQYPDATEELFYDRAGNRTKRLYNGAEELYRYDKRNRLTAHTKGGVTSQYEYDNAGNLLKDDKARYEYDAFNRNTKVETFNGNIQINRYDAEGLRHEMEETTVMQACPGSLYPLSSVGMKSWQRRAQPCRHVRGRQDPLYPHQRIISIRRGKRKNLLPLCI